MESFCAQNCQALVKCQCGEFLCSHTMGHHMILGHSALSMTETGLMSSFPSIFGLISEYKEKIVQRGTYLTQQVGKLVSSQIVRLEQFER